MGVTNLIGTAAELHVAALLLEQGFEVAFPMGLPAWDLLVRGRSKIWSTVQVKRVSVRGDRTAHTRVVDTRRSAGPLRRRTRLGYEEVDFMVAYDLESGDHWVFEMAGIARQITLGPRLHGFRNLELLHALPCPKACQVPEAPCARSLRAG